MDDTTINKKLMAEDMETVVLLRTQGSGAPRHNDLTNRDAMDCHQISSITGLAYRVIPSYDFTPVGSIVVVSNLGLPIWKDSL